MPLKNQHIISRLLSPFTLPIIYFGVAILLGGFVLHMPVSLNGGSIEWTDAFFTATSAVCVTGLSVVDMGTTFSRFGHMVVMVLMELGGVGLMAYSSMLFYMWAHRLSLANYFILKESLSPEVTFNLGSFLLRIFIIVAVIELIGAVLLYWFDPVGFSPFSAIFHSVSAFANGGFSLHATNLEAWRGHWGINLVFIVLITCGCIGFSVLAELEAFIRSYRKGSNERHKFAWHTKVVVKTHLALLLFGAIFLLIGSGSEWSEFMDWDEVCLASLFQSATCRTAGFNTVDISSIGLSSMLLMIFLMYVGGAPGSCAGGIKVTTFRTLLSYIFSEVMGNDQVVVSGSAVTRQTLRNAITLAIFSLTIILSVTYFMSLSKSMLGASGHEGEQFLNIIFDVVSAFGTVGLSSGALEHAANLQKWLFMFLMFVGRLGPIVFLSMMKEWQEKKHYTWPEDTLMVG